MSAAIIPIGIACQGTKQLYDNRALIASLVGEPLAYRSSFFNWTMVGSDDICRSIERMFAGPVDTASVHVPPAYMRCNMIVGHKIWLWHEKPSHETPPEKRALVAAKYEHLRLNFLDLCTRPKRYFVLCNAQNNLVDQDPHRHEGMRLDIDDEIVRDVTTTLDRLLPNGTNTLITASRPDRAAPGMRERIFFLEPDDTEWMGSPTAWAALAEACFKSEGRAA